MHASVWCPRLLTGIIGVTEMAQPVKEVATKPKPELEPQNPHGKRKMTPTMYTQLMTTAAVYVHIK